MIRRRRRGGADRDFGFAELRGGSSRVVIIPSLGGKIAAMEIGGRQWLWKNDQLPYREPQEGTSYVETADSGGYDECFPTIAPCHLPPAAGRFGGLSLPDHGELWSQRAQMRIATPTSAMDAASSWRGRLMPYRFTRRIRVGPDGAVHMRYMVRNEGEERLPFLWSSHPLLPLTPETRIVLPDALRVRVAHVQGLPLTGGTEHRWPYFRLEKSVVNMSKPDSVARKYAVKLFIDLPPEPVVLAVEEGSARLEAHVDGSQIPQLGLWLNRRGWAGVPDARPYTNFGFEPCIGAPDSLADAMGSWHGAHWLEGGGKREWAIVWKGGMVEQDRGKGGT